MLYKLLFSFFIHLMTEKHRYAENDADFSPCCLSSVFHFFPPPPDSPYSFTIKHTRCVPPLYLFLSHFSVSLSLSHTHTHLYIYTVHIHMHISVCCDAHHSDFLSEYKINPFAEGRKVWTEQPWWREMELRRCQVLLAVIWQRFYCILHLDTDNQTLQPKVEESGTFAWHRTAPSLLHTNKQIVDRLYQNNRDLKGVTTVCKATQLMLFDV